MTNFHNTHIVVANASATAAPKAKAASLPSLPTLGMRNLKSMHLRAARCVEGRSSVERFTTVLHGKLTKDLKIPVVRGIVQELVAELVACGHKGYDARVIANAVTAVLTRKVTVTVAVDALRNFSAPRANFRNVDALKVIGFDGKALDKAWRGFCIYPENVSGLVSSVLHGKTTIEAANSGLACLVEEHEEEMFERRCRNVDAGADDEGLWTNACRSGNRPSTESGFSLRSWMTELADRVAA